MSRVRDASEQTAAGAAPRLSAAPGRSTMKRVGFKRLRDAGLGVLLVLGVAACTWQGIKPDETGPRRLYISGQSAHVTDKQIAQIAAPYLKTSFFDVDIKALQDRLETQPWLTDVQVSRHWPDGVLVHVAEHEAVAEWGKEGLLGADGQVFVPDHRPSGLIQLDGPSASGLKVYKQYRQLSGILADHDVHLAALSLDQRGAWTARLDNGLELRLGREQLAQRLQRFVDFALNRTAAKRALASAGYVDLRYSDGFAVGGSRTASTADTHQEKMG